MTKYSKVSNLVSNHAKVQKVRSPRRNRLAICVLSALSAAPVVFAGSSDGQEFQINTFANSSQRAPAIAMRDAGDFVVVWQSFGISGFNEYSIFGQRFDAFGVQQGEEFLVDTFPQFSKSNPDVAIDDDGDFVVVWSSEYLDASEHGIFGQRFDSAGVKQGSEFQVNTYFLEHQRAPKIAMDDDGDFVIVWQSENQDGSVYGVYGQRFDSTGVKQGGEFLINTYTSSAQTQPEVAMEADGDFVVVWQSFQDGSGNGIFGQRFNSAGGQLGVEFQVNTYTTYYQSLPAIAMNATGDFVVTWESASQDGSDFGVYGQRFDASGNKQGIEFGVNTYTTGNQISSDVAMDTDGDFVVTWDRSEGDYYYSNFNSDVYGQRFDASGNKRGEEFQANVFAMAPWRFSALDREPSTALNGRGESVIAWTSWGQDGDREGIFGRRISSNPAEGFNGDGYADIFWREDASGRNILWDMQGFERLAVQTLPNVSSAWHVGGVGDLNGDCIDDLLWRNETTGANLAWLMEFDYSKTEVLLPSVFDTDWKIAGLGDIDGNKHADIIWRNQTDGRNAAWRLDTTGGGVTVTAGSLNTVPNMNWKIEAIGDVDGDEKADIVWRHKNLGRNLVWLMDDLDSASRTLPNTASHWDMVGSGDLNNDSKTDLVWRSSTGANAVWLLDGGAILDDDLIFTIADSNWQVAQVADYSGDGNADILWRNISTGQNVVFNMSGTKLQFYDLIPSLANTGFKTQPED